MRRSLGAWWLLFGGLLAAQDATLVVPTARLLEGMTCLADPSQTYTLYLPSSYDPARRWPVLVVMDPRGRSVFAAGLFQEAAEEYGWILVSSDDTRSDTNAEVNQKAVSALWSEIHSRYACDPARIYAAGFSGTMATGFALGRSTGQLAGVIGCGGRHLPKLQRGIDFPVFGAVGTTDFNFHDMRRLESQLLDQGTPHRFEVFAGPHRWMPEPMARRAVEWLELQAMRRKLRPRDEALANRLHAADMAAAAALEAAGHPTAAMRRYRAIVRTFRDLHSVESAGRRADRLSESDEVSRTLEAERHWQLFESRFRQDFSVALTRFLEREVAPSARRLADELRIEDLGRRAASKGAEGTTAQRLLNHYFAILSFYLPRDLLPDGRYGHAASALSVAVEIRDDSALAWYNLACARARSGRQEKALEALDRAICAGFTDVDHIERDPDLQSLQELERFGALLSDLRVEADSS